MLSSCQASNANRFTTTSNDDGTPDAQNIDVENVGRIENVGFPYTMLFAPFPCALSSLVLCCAVPEPRSVCTACVCVYVMNVEYCSFAMA